MFSTVPSVCFDATIKAELLIVFYFILAFEISHPMPQHEAITVQTNGKMILTDQLIIEDRNEERGAKDESADSLTVIACLNQTIENTL